MITFALLSVSVQSLFSSTSAESICWKAYDCIGDFINTTDGFQSKGYKSNYGHSSSIRSTDTIQVTGDFACSAIGLLEIIDNGYISIDGANGVSSGTINVIDGANGVGAYAATSLTNATITCQNSDDCSVECLGDMSCYSSIINNANTIDAFGSYSLANSVIVNNDDDNDLTVSLYGYLSGYNATINCFSGNNNCEINCKSNGCFGLRVNCDDSINCQINGCNESMSIPCPQVTYYTNLDDNTDNYNDYFIEFQSNNDNKYQLDSYSISLTNDINCNLDNPSIITYDDADNTASSSLSTTESSNICCRASDACYDIPSIKITGTAANGGDIICSGMYSCENIDASTGNNNDYINTEDSKHSSIYCSGRESCKSSIMKSSIDDTDRTLNETGIIYCGGWSSCVDSTIYGSYKLYCSGTSACNSAEIYGVHYVYATGYLALSGATVHSGGVGNMTVVIAAYHAVSDGNNDITVDCANTDYCNVICVTNGACNSLKIISNKNGNSNVKIVCDDSSGLSCPDPSDSIDSVDDSVDDSGDTGGSTDVIETTAGVVDEGKSKNNDDRTSTHVTIGIVAMVVVFVGCIMCACCPNLFAWYKQKRHKRRGRVSTRSKGTRKNKSGLSGADSLRG